MHLAVLAPRVTGPYRDEAQALGMTALSEEPGVWRLQGGAAIFPMRVLETEVLTGLNHPLLTVFSPQVIHQPRLVYDNLTQAGYTDMAVYMFQQIRHFSESRKEFVMQHLGFDEIAMEIFKNTPLEIRLRSMTTEERLKGLSAEERLKGLSPEEREQLLKLLQQESNKPRNGD